MFPTLLILAATGQCLQVQTARTYAVNRRAAIAYAAPVQYQRQAVAYAQPYAQVEKTLFVVTEPTDAYYSGLVGDRVRAEQRARQQAQGEVDLATQVGQLSARVGQLAEVVARIGGQTAPAPPDPDPSTGPPAPPVPVPNPAGSPNQAAAAAVMQAACAKCHTGEAKAGGGFAIFTAPGVLAALPPLKKLKIEQQTYSGKMPKQAKPLSAEDYSVLRAWVNDSEAEIAAAIEACEEKTEAK